MDTLKRLKTFIGSPSDCVQSREAARQAVDLVSETLEPHGLILRSRMWEFDARPDVGPDAQASLNRQIVADCDLYIFLFHGRLGTPTARSVSGTADELEVALCNFRASTRAVRILVYFDTTPLPPMIDAKELLRLQEFRARIQASGFLCIEFNGPSHLKDRLIRDLRNAALEVAEGESLVPIATSDKALTEEEEEGPGTLEYMARIADTAASTTESLQKFVEFQERVSAEMVELTAEVKTIAPIFPKMAVGEKLKLMNGYADRISAVALEAEPYAEGLSLQLSELAAQVQGVVSEIVRGEGNESEESLVELSDAISRLGGNIGGAAASAIELEDSIKAWPGFTQKFKKARNRLATSYRKIRSAMETTVDALSLALNSLPPRRGPSEA